MIKKSAIKGCLNGLKTSESHMIALCDETKENRDTVNKCSILGELFL